MFKSLIPALTVALLGNSITTAQYFGVEYPALSEYSQPARSIRIARASDNEPSDNLDNLDALDALDPPASLDFPEPLELPMPTEADKPASPSDSNVVQPEISNQDLEPQSIVELSPAPVTPIPGAIDFNEAIQQQQRDLAYSHHHSNPSQYYDGTTHHAGLGGAAHVSTDGGCNGQSVGRCNSSMAPLPYRAPLLPPSNNFHGHFKANPCYYDLWANYPAEAASACAHNRAKPAPPRKTGCLTCELVDRCPRR